MCAEGRDVATQDRNLWRTNYSGEKLSPCGEGRDAAPKDWNLQQTVSRKAVGGKADHENNPRYPADSNPGDGGGHNTPHDQPVNSPRTNTTPESQFHSAAKLH
ncbi:hypothetical protein FIBSPDRAFT_884959 [Athelia psychrophila]|uniref:Uncharacterized protein n=1 Tax=Athelia psychrophila TaxID=1759441 RepID=A0A166SKY3_9AGAM|nr:hypothetical protein FIBSPDRAFT_884959 [Fibularhizoctonia sp. CBS 109695]